eukprot:m.452927 g.452927  ORF g.452927 m.452927 type:complete len:191 (-) comp20412_c0_seq1:199-771(-)
MSTAYDASFGEVKNRLRFEAEALHAAAESLSGTLQRHRNEYVSQLELRLTKLEEECHMLRARLAQQEHDDAARFDQAKMESVNLARMWEAEKRRLVDENRELSEDVIKARRAAETEAGTNGKLRIELGQCHDELRAADARDGILAAAQADRDAAIAEAAMLRRELAILRSRFNRGGGTESHVHESVHVRL